MVRVKGMSQPEGVGENGRGDHLWKVVQEDADAGPYEEVDEDQESY